MTEPSQYQQDIYNWIGAGTGINLLVDAVAGSGKTYTIVNGIKYSTAPRKLLVAFNKHIATELTTRVSSDVADIKTYHALGLKSLGKVQVDTDKLEKVLKGILGTNNKDVYYPAKKLVGLCKGSLFEFPSNDQLDDQAAHHDIDVDLITEYQKESKRDLVFETTKRAMRESLEWDSVVDFDDMCSMPIFHDVSVKQYDFIAVDELQDTNPAQLALAIKFSGGHLVGVGDPYQAIYGFRGADSNAIPSFLRATNAEALPLSITYRNPRKIVELVNSSFPHIKFEASPSAKEGSILNMDYKQAEQLFDLNDMILCRTNAPLVAPCYSLIRQGKKATILGKNIGKGLITLIKRMRADTLENLLVALIDYRDKEVRKLYLADKRGLAARLDDQVETIIAISDACKSIQDMKDKISMMFDDTSPGVTFSTVHKAKGLEAQRVFILHPELMPHKMAKQAWEKQQEDNIKYVAITRTLDTLVWVTGEPERIM